MKNLLFAPLMVIAIGANALAQDAPLKDSGAFLKVGQKKWNITSTQLR